MKRQFTGRRTGLWGAGILLIMVVAVSGQTEFPDGDGKALVVDVCASQCHGEESWAGLRLNEEGWHYLVEDMASRSGTSTAEQMNTMVQYLARHFGMRKTATPANSPQATDSEKINVNKATSEELESFLALPHKEAEAIIQYREKNGSFLTWEDIKKVPNLDIQQLEPKKDRLTY